MGGSCVLNSDCSQDLVCTWGKCHDGCHTSADCAAGQSCIISSDQSRVCQLPAETHCLYDSDCQIPLTCAVDKRCHNQCQTSVDCPSGQICTTTKACAQPDQVDVNDNFLASDGGFSGPSGAPDADASTSCATGVEGCSCYLNDTCNTGLTCAFHFCVRPDAGSDGGAGARPDAGGKDVGKDVAVGEADAASGPVADAAGLVTPTDVPIDLPVSKPPDAGIDGDSGTSDAASRLGLVPDLGSDRPADAGPTGCLIDSTSYPSGAANPANPCQTCQPAVSGSTWTNASNGTGCGSGQVCSVGICRLGCWLDVRITRRRGASRATAPERNPSAVSHGQTKLRRHELWRRTGVQSRIVRNRVLAERHLLCEWGGQSRQRLSGLSARDVGYGVDQ